MSNFAKLIMQHTGLPAAHESGEMTFLLNNGKACILNDWSNLYKLDHPNRPTLEDLSEWEHGFGRLLHLYPNGDYPLVLDIDLDSESAEIILDYILKNKVLSEHACVIRTASDKCHCDFRVTGKLPEGKHDFSKKWQFPYDFPVEEHRNKPLGSKIELQTSGQEAFCGTEIDGKSYHVDERSKIKDITKLPTIEYSDLMEELEKVMLLNGFTTYTPALASEDIEKETNVGFVGNSKRHDLPNYLVEKEAEEILMILKANDGSKHDIYLALGNFYANMAKISKESAIKIHEKILEKAPTLFNNNADALKTLLKGYNNNDNNKKQTGAKHIYDEHASSLESAQEFWFKRFKYTHNITKYFPNGQTGKKYDCIVENPYTKQIELHKIRVKTNKDGSFDTYVDEVKPVLGLEIVEIERIQNSIVPSANDTFRFSYIASGRRNIQTIEGSTLKEIQDKLRSQIGIVLSSSFGYVFNQIVAFYTRNNLIKVSKIAPVAGIFEIDGVLRRFDYDLKEIEPKYDKKGLINAWDLLEEIKNILPVDNEKFGAILADATLLPFQFVLKQHGHMVKYQLLLGAGKTWKSSIGELELNFYNPTRINSVSGNLFNAGAFGSEYQVGLKFGISSYPVVINEVAKAFNDEDIIEILKSAIETHIARSTNDGVYYSYSTLIMTSNVDLPQTDAMVRRSNTYYFTPSERLSEDDIDALAELLNKTGTNSRFKELSPIGDFVFTFLHNNMDLLDTLNTDELRIRIIEEMEKETLKDLSWCKQDVKEDNNVVIDELDADTLANITQEIKTIYNYNFRNYHNYDYKDDEGTHYKTMAFSEENLVALIARGAIPFLAYDNKADKIFIIGHRVKDFFAKKHHKIVTNKQLIEEFEPFADNYEVLESRMRIDGKNNRGVRCDVELIIDLLNNEIHETTDDDSNGWTDEEEQMLQRLLAKKEAAK